MSGLWLDCQLWELKCAEGIERWCQDTGLAWSENIVAITVHREGTDTNELITTFIINVLSHFVNLVLNTSEGFGVTDIVCFNIRLGEQRVVDLQLRIESQCAQRREEDVLILFVARVDMVRHEPT